MRVLHVITGLAAGGAEHQLRLLLKRLPEECEVVTLSNPGVVADAIRADGTVVHELSMRSNRDVSVIRDLRRLMRRGRFDLVHTHLYRACVHGRVAARLAGIRRIVATEHSLGDGVIEGRRAGSAVRALYLATERLGQATVAVSEAVAARLRAWGVPADRIVVIPNGIDAAEFRFDPEIRARERARLGIAPAALVIGAVGRMEPTKRFERLISATQRIPEATLLLAGDGSVREALEQRARAAGMADRVVFAGAVAHARDVLCAMDVFAAPSDQETFGLAVIEALACGLPAVYGVCPPLDEHAAAHGVADRSTAPGARRLSALDGQSLSRTLRAELAAFELRSRHRLPVPDVVTQFDTERLAGAVSGLYRHLESEGTRR